MIRSESAQGVAAATAWTPLPGPPTSAPHQQQLAYSLARKHLARPVSGTGRRTTRRGSTFLPTFAQRGFALRASRPLQIDPRQGTPPRHLQWTGVSAASALGRPGENIHYSAGSDSCRRSPPTNRSPRLPRLIFPSFHPQPRDAARGSLYTPMTSVHGEFQASPPPSGLATTPRRNGFVILRTDSSPPVALHPASRRRSYLRLRSFGILRHGLSPC